MKLLMMIYLTLSCTQVFAAVVKRQADFAVELDNVKRIHVNVLVLPKIKIKYVKIKENASALDKAAVLKVFAAGDSEASISGLLDVRGNFANEEAALWSGTINHECEMRQVNGVVVSVKGACFLSAQMRLPKGSRVEVYQNDRLITDIFTAMSFNELNKQMWYGDDKEKQSVIDLYLRSYKNAGATPELTADQLGKVLKLISSSKSKLTALKKLHKTVVDRDSLYNMIDDVFYFASERTAAYKIVK